MLREKIVFGPIFSRRLGSSLGINLLPENGKICNFDCIYCECGWNSDGREDSRLPLPAELETALRSKLQDCRDNGVRIDSITFSGDGEPTLNPHFPEMIDITLQLRDEFFPQSAVSVLSNATMIRRPEVRAALMRVDNPILKLDGGIDRIVSLVNQPSGKYSVADTFEALKEFKGEFVLQTMFLKGPGFSSLEEENVAAWRRMVLELRPREVMVYSIDRQTPAEGLEKCTAEEMEAVTRPLAEAGIKIQIKG